MGATIADIDQQLVATSLFEESNDGLFLIQPADKDILDVTLIVAYFNFVNRIALGLGVTFDAEELSGYRDD